MRTVLTNGVIHHGQYTAGFETCNTMVINDDLIEFVGNDPKARTSNFADEAQQSEIVDLDGRCVFPAFVDGHMHMLLFGSSLVKIGLDNCRNIDEIRETIANGARGMPNAQRILCRGWRQPSTNREALASMIDDIDPRPIFIDSDDLHSEWCNSAALTEMGITRDTPNPAGGTIHRDENGDATGLVSEAAMESLVWPHLMGAMSRDEKLNCIVVAMDEYNASGYTSVVEMAMDRGSWDLLEILHKQGRRTLRIAAHWLIEPTGDDEKNLTQVQDAINMHNKYNLENSPDFRITGIKIICDGVVDSCTAALSKPYLVSPYGTGELIWTPSTVQKVVTMADLAHLQVALHAIGDAAINMSINVLESLGTTGRRHRIEHLEMTRPEDAKRLGALGITASVQPVHSDPSILGAWPDLLGPERCGWVFAHHEFHRYGAQLAIGTDSPTAPHLPFPNMYVANTRTSSRDLSNHSKINQIPPIELYQAWNAATWGSAYSCFAEKMVGSLQVGKKADFIVVDGLSSGLDAKSILQATVTETWMDGRRIVPNRIPAV